jgi:hypothetical protein
MSPSATRPPAFLFFDQAQLFPVGRTIRNQRVPLPVFSKRRLQTGRNGIRNQRVPLPVFSLAESMKCS